MKNSVPPQSGMKYPVENKQKPRYDDVYILVYFQQVMGPVPSTS